MGRAPPRARDRLCRGSRMKRFITLDGPNGSGNSTIGSLLEAEPGIRFSRVEPLLLARIVEVVRPLLGRV